MVKHVAGGHWAFPKGHVEAGETEEQTAVREVLEETGVAITLLPGFRETNRYSPRRGISKQVVYFLARAKTDAPHPQPEEIREARFVPLAEAMALLTYPADRRLLQKAEQFAQLTG
jgi:8-oxo-dGTP pyrophosphatase MutT (NUDIX family)